MKLCVAALLGISLSFAEAARSDEHTTARKIIDDAIEATGGQARLTKFSAATWKSKGTFRIGDDVREFMSDWAIHAPQQYRKAKVYPQEGDDSQTILVLNGDEAWFWRKGRLFSFKNRELAPVRAEHYTHWLALRLEIGHSARLSLLDDMRLDGRLVVGVKVQGKDVPAVDLYFDKATRLLARTDTYITTSGGGQATETRVFRHYKQTDGIKYASVVHWTGKNGDQLATQEEERSDFAVHERLDEALFARPDMND